MIEGIIYRNRCGIAWCDLPADFRPWQTVWKSPRARAGDGTRDQVLDVLLVRADADGELDRSVAVGSTICRAYQHGTDLECTTGGRCGNARTSVASAALGEIVGLTGLNNGQLPTARDWFTDVALAGGGALLDHTVHVAQILDSLLGEPDTVQAVVNRVLWPTGRVRAPRQGAW